MGNIYYYFYQIEGNFCVEAFNVWARSELNKKLASVNPKDVLNIFKCNFIIIFYKIEANCCLLSGVSADIMYIQCAAELEAEEAGIFNAAGTHAHTHTHVRVAPFV